LKWLALLLFACGALRAEAPQLMADASANSVSALAPSPMGPETSAGTASAASVSSMAKAWGHAGVTYALSLSNWALNNASPLAYTPFEMGYDLGNGARLQTGIDLFDYEAVDIDGNRYSYAMTDWRTSLLYRLPWQYRQFRLRPLVGISVDVVNGSKSLTPYWVLGVDQNANAPKLSAWSYIGLGVQAGLEYLLSADWSLQLSERYESTFNTVASPMVTQLGATITF
jgi:hypothetical protein